MPASDGERLGSPQRSPIFGFTSLWQFAVLYLIAFGGFLLVVALL